MDNLLKETDFSAYDPCFMKRKLEELDGEDIIISGGSGLKTIVTYRKSVNSILREYYNTPKDTDMNLQKITLMETTAMIVKSEMKDISRSFNEYFPTTDDLSVDMLYQYSRLGTPLSRGLRSQKGLRPFNPLQKHCINTCQVPLNYCWKRFLSVHSLKSSR